MRTGKKIKTIYNEHLLLCLGSLGKTISFPPARKRRVWNSHDTGLNGYLKGSDACHNFFFWFVKYFYFILKFYLALLKIESHPETFCPFARNSLCILPRDFTGDSLSSSPMSPFLSCHQKSSNPSFPSALWPWKLKEVIVTSSLVSQSGGNLPSTTFLFHRSSEAASMEGGSQEGPL